jgi:hypothetical protein
VNGCSARTRIHSLPAAQEQTTQTHMKLSSVIDPTLDGMVPFKPLPKRALLEGRGGGKGQKGGVSIRMHAMHAL